MTDHHVSEPDPTTSLDAPRDPDEGGGVQTFSGDRAVETLPGDGHRPDSGEFVAGYRIVRRLAATPEGVVYKAQEKSSKRSIVVRVMRSSTTNSPARLAALQRDLDTLRHMSHAGLARVLDGGVTEDGQLYLAWEFIRGTAMREHAQSRRLVVEDWISIFRRIGDALHYMHQHCVVHRDLRPSNILIEGDGSPRIVGIGVAPITDFDLVAPRSPIPGVTAYQSPEQRSGNRHRIDVRSDIYALGVMLFEVMTGRLPDSPEGAEDISPARLIGSTLAPARRTIDPELEAIARKAMESEPNARYQTVAEFTEDLDNYLNRRPVRACSQGAGYRCRKFLVRCRLWVVLLTAGLAAVVGLGITAFIERNQESMHVVNEEKRRSAETIGGLLEAVKRTEEDTAQREAALEAERQRLTRAEQSVVDLQGQLSASRGENAVLAERLRQVQEGERRTRLVLKALADVFRLAEPDTGLARNAAAVELVNRALAKAREEHREQPMVLSAIMTHFGEAYRNMGQVRRAAEILQESVDLRLRSSGANDEALIEALNALVAAYYAAGDYRNVEPACRRLVLASEEVYGPDAQPTITAVNNLALTLQKQGNFVEAEQMFTRAVEGRRREYGAGDLRTAQSDAGLAQVLVAQGKHAQAEPRFREVLAVFGELRPKGDWQTARTAGQLGDCLRHLKRFADAEPLLLESETALRAALGEEHIETRLAAERLANLYTDWGRPERAASWKARQPPRSGS